MGYFNANDPLGQFSLVPTPKKMLTSTSYLDFTGNAAGGDPVNNFAQQYLPEIYEAEVERYGNRTIGGFLRMVGAEMPMTSDQVIWSEQNRLHIAFTGASIAADGSNEITGLAGQDSAGNDIIPSIRKGQTIVVSNNTSLLSTKCYVKADPVAAGGKWKIVAYSYDLANLNTLVGAGQVDVFVYGSEFAKGTAGMEGSIEPSFTQYHNSPVIIKDKYEINGSDTAQIGWVEVAVEDGSSGYLWYLKAEGETRLRFQDYLEMVMIEGEKAVAGSAAIGEDLLNSTVKVKGTEGLFAAIEGRGNIYDNFASGVDGGGNARTSLQDFDLILQNLDKQGAIEENMLFLNRATALSFDDMLAAQNSYGAGGTSYGVFENSEEMALNLGFSGFRRGSYDFYKTDWKYLNDATTGGLNETVDGVMVPAGTSTVYDQMLGANIRRPFLHVRYRASEADDRRMKTWLTGSVGGAYTTGDDVMKVHFLSERCLVTQAANNFVIFKSVA